MREGCEMPEEIMPGRRPVAIDILPKHSAHHDRTQKLPRGKSKTVGCGLGDHPCSVHG